MPQKVLRVGSETDRFAPPIAQAVKRPDSQPPKAGLMCALRGFEPPVEISFWTGGVHVGVDLAVVGFLIDDQPLGAGLDERSVLPGFHRADLKRDGRDGLAQRRDAVSHVAAGNKFRMFPGD